MSQKQVASAMWAPQFNLRFLLCLTAIAAVFAGVANQAWDGAAWAQTLMALLVTCALTFLLMGCLFLVATLLSGGWSTLLQTMRPDDASNAPEGLSPFVEHRPPGSIPEREEPL